MSGSSAEREDLQLAVDYAWKWFELHSAQRMQLISSLIFAMAFITAGYAASIGAHRFGVACGVAVGGMLVAFVFERLDIRTRELVQACEPCLTDLEQRIAKIADIDKLRFVPRVQHPQTRLTSYRTVLRILTRSAMTLYLAGLVYAFSEAI